MFHIKKIQVLSLSLALSITGASISLAFAQSEDSALGGGTSISHTTINQSPPLATKEEKAAFWGIDNQDWEKYEKYMEIEGKLFYPNLSPLNVMALITDDEDQRNMYIAKHVIRERARVKNEVQLTHDAWRIQKAMFGAENVVDFSSVPWGADFDERTIIHNIPITEADRQAPAFTQQGEDEFKETDEIVMVFDPKSCVNSGEKCKEQLKIMLKNQPLSIVILALETNESDFNSFAETISLNTALETNKVRVELLDQEPFHFDTTPVEGDMYLLRNGMIIRKVE